MTVLETSTSPAPGERRDSRADVDRHAPNVVADELDLAGVETRPDLQAEGPERIRQGQRAADGAGRAVEDGQEPVAGGADLASGVARQLIAYPGVMSVEHVGPGGVGELGGALGGAHDVREQHGREHPVGLGLGPCPGQEFLDLAEDRIRVADPGKMVVPVELDDRRPRDALGHEPAGLDRDGPIARSVEDQGRHANGREDGSDVDLGVHPGQGENGSGAGTHADVAGPVLAEPSIAEPARRSNVEADRPTPIPFDLLQERLLTLDRATRTDSRGPPGAGHSRRRG